MKEQIYTIEAFKRESKLREIKVWFADKKDKTVEFIEEHRDTIVVLAPVIFTCVTTGIRMVSRHVALAKTKDLKDLYCYDRSAGHYWPLRRKLTTREWIEIDSRRENGERLKDILLDLKVLK